MGRLKEPWYMLTCNYYNNGKVRAAGPAAALCHQYVMAKVKMSGVNSVSKLDWVSKKIWAWAGVFQSVISIDDISTGMEQAIEWELILEADDTVSIHDYEDYILEISREKERERKQLQRVKSKRDNLGHSGTNWDMSQNAGTKPDASDNNITSHNITSHNIGGDPKASSPKSNNVYKDNDNRMSEPPPSGPSAAVYYSIKAQWPDFEDRDAREAAARMLAEYPACTPDLVAAARNIWPLSRPMYGPNGLHGFLVKYARNEKNSSKQSQDGPQSPQQVGGTPRLKSRLGEIKRRIEGNIRLDMSELQSAYNTAVEDKFFIHDVILNRVLAAVKNDWIELTKTRKIERWMCQDKPYPNQLLAANEETGKGNIVDVVENLTTGFEL